MFIRVIPNNKGKKKTYFCDLVESFRDETGLPKHKTVVKLGQFEGKYIPYLKAAYSSEDPDITLAKELKRGF